MNAPHVFVDPGDCRGGGVDLRGDVAHHLVRVLRRGVGDDVSVADGTGAVRHVAIRSVDEGVAHCEVVAERAIPSVVPRLRVVCGLPRQRKLDVVVQRLSELGADEIVPAHTARSQVQLAGPRAQRARARWQAVARAAGEQSRRARLLHVAEVTTWQDAFAGPHHGVVFWEEAARPLRDVAFDAETTQVTVGVGPEGGLTADEVTAAGLPAVSLGGTILRTETAGMVAPALVLHRLGRFG